MSGQGLRLADIVARLGGELIGDGDTLICGIGTLAEAGQGDIAFLANPKYRGQLADTGASAVIVPPAAADGTERPRIVAANSYLYYARVAQLLHPTAVPNPPIHPSAVIGEGVTLGRNVVIHAGCVIGDGVSIGDDTVIYPNAVIYQDCVIGARCVIQAGAVIGADGFGFAKDGAAWVKIPQIGRVVIGDDVEVGANSTIDRGAIDDTVIANGVKIDNLVMIAHNVQIGEHTAMAGCVGIAGSTKIGARCTIGGAGMISGHLTLGDDVHISGATLVARNLPNPGHYTAAYPLEVHEGWLKNAAHLRHLDKLAKRVKELEKKLEKSEGTN